MQISDNQLGFSHGMLPTITSPVSARNAAPINHFQKRYNSTYRAPTEMPIMAKGAAVMGAGVVGGKAAIHSRKQSLTMLKSF